MFHHILKVPLLQTTVATLLTFLPCSGFAQSELPRSFDVASVKLLTGPCSAALPCELTIQTTPSSLVLHGYPLGRLVRWAYNLPMEQPAATVGPDWIEPGGKYIRYDIVGKVDHPVSVNDLRLMLRTLLAERLKLTVHPERREMSVYVLAVSTGGPKLQPSREEGEAKFTPPAPAGGDVWWWGVWRLENVELGQLHEFLWPFVPVSIVNETGIEGRFDIALNVGRYRDYYVSPTPGTRADLGPVLDRALQEIGLRLESKRRPVGVLVIDRVEKTPLDN